MDRFSERGRSNGGGFLGFMIFLAGLYFAYSILTGAQNGVTGLMKKGQNSLFKPKSQVTESTKPAADAVRRVQVSSDLQVVTEPDGTVIYEKVEENPYSDSARYAQRTEKTPEEISQYYSDRVPRHLKVARAATEEPMEYAGQGGNVDPFHMTAVSEDKPFKGIFDK